VAVLEAGGAGQRRVDADGGLGHNGGGYGAGADA
jgi:hypothetical protein